jgi:hypothetical protein
MARWMSAKTVKNRMDHVSADTAGGYALNLVCSLIQWEDIWRGFSQGKVCAAWLARGCRMVVAMVPHGGPVDNRCNSHWDKALRQMKRLPLLPG